MPARYKVFPFKPSLYRPVSFRRSGPKRIPSSVLSHMFASQGLKNEIMWLVAAAKRAKSPKARERLFQAAHRKRLQVAKLRPFGLYRRPVIGRPQ